MIEGFNCPNCGAPADHAGAKACNYCSTPFLLANSRSNSSLTNETLGKYADLYKRVTKDDPDYFDSQISLVLIYIKRSLPQLAENLSKKILEEFPDHPDAYLWRAISILKSGEIRKLKIAQAKEASQLIYTGNALTSEDGRSDFIYVAKVLKQQYFNQNDVIPPDQLIEVLEGDCMGSDHSSETLLPSILG
jgi:hypothetical protein